jgi:hypothetical protein
MKFPAGLLPNPRAWNIGLRTAHIATMGVLLGGHAFGVSKEELLPWFWMCLATGSALAVVEVGPRLVWFHQGRGLMTLAKLGLLGCVPWFWDYRFPILLAIVVIASVGSHMPARFRYYSVLYREVIRTGAGPGLAQLDDEACGGEE